MRKILPVVGLAAILASPTWADEALTHCAHGNCIVVVVPDGAGPNDQIVCGVPGVTSAIAFARDDTPVTKPLRGYCTNAFGFGGKVPIRQGWPVNLGTYQNKIGMDCRVEPDGYHFTCDWPPYSTVEFIPTRPAPPDALPKDQQPLGSGKPSWYHH